ncbi:carbohydrate sulfotransferase 15-like [Diadema antillarum]|uniref:carbohydrate sulfotransferase 15-like n=1 Tax=Diadema antillarum TaxID=105358 RepID=UPI003A884C76
MKKCQVQQFLRRGFLLGLFLVSTLMCICSWSLMAASDLHKATPHLGSSQPSRLQHAQNGDLRWDKFHTTSDTVHETRPPTGYYGDGYNIRKLPPELFKLAPQVFDEIPQTFLPMYKNPCFIYRGAYPPGLRCLPYFYLIGMQKCGSTDMWEKINEHDEVQRTEKEPHWWARYRVRDLPPDYGNYTTPLSLGWYLDAMSYKIVPRLVQTPETASWLVIGDGSTSTLWDNQWQTLSPTQFNGPEYTIADVMRVIQPNAKFIVVLRDPIVRVYSDYLFFGNEKDDVVSKTRFHDIVSEGIQVFRQCLTNNSERACTYLHGTQHARLLLGNYAVFLHDWLKVFPRHQLLVLRLEDWQSRCPSVLREIFAFLNLSPLTDSRLVYICAGERKRVNAQMREHIGDMLTETRTLLNDFYGPMNGELATLLNDERYNMWSQEL